MNALYDLQKATETLTELEKTLVGTLLEISKEEDETEHTAVWSIAVEGEIDRDGDMFAPGSIEMMRDKGTVVHFQHSYEPAGVWTLSRNGNQVMANVTFLKTEVGKGCYEYVKAMDDSCQFSFRARYAPGGIRVQDGVPGLVFSKVMAYETSPVMVGAGETKLVSIKSQAQEGEMEKTAEELEQERLEKERIEKAAAELRKSQDADEMPAWAKALESKVDKAVGILDAPAQQAAQMENIKTGIAGLSDEQKKELGISVVEGTAEVRKVYPEAAKNGGIADIMKAANDRQDDIKRYLDGSLAKVSFEFRSEPEEILKATLAGIGTVQSQVPTVIRVANRTQALDQLPMRPVVGNMVRAPYLGGFSDLQGAGPAGVDIVDEHDNVDQAVSANDAIHRASPAYGSTGEFPVRVVSGSAPIAKSDIEDDPSLLPVIVADALRGGRQRILAAVMRGQTGAQAITGFSTAIAGGNTDAIAASGDGREILSGPVDGLENRVSGLLNRVMPNMIFASGTDYGRIYTAQRQNYFVTPGGPGGAMDQLAHVMGVPVIVNPYNAANTILIGEFSEDVYFLGVRRDIRVEMSDDEEFSSDMMVVKVTARIANCIRQVNAFFQVTATNNYQPER